MNNFIEGKYINLRDVELSDAEFIVNIRTDAKKTRFLHPTSGDVQQQVEYLKKYKTKDKEWYFIIMDKQNLPIGTVRIYDVKGDDFCWGSWLIIDGMPPQIALESALLIYDYAFNVLGFNKAHFDVRKGNIQVQRFHEMFGAIKTSENELDYFYKYGKNTYLEKLSKFQRMI